MLMVILMRQTTSLLEAAYLMLLQMLGDITMISFQVETLLFLKVSIVPQHILPEAFAVAILRDLAQLSGLPPAVCGWGIWHLLMMGCHWLPKISHPDNQGYYQLHLGVIVIGMGDQGILMRDTDRCPMSQVFMIDFHLRYNS